MIWGGGDGVLLLVDEGWMDGWMDELGTRPTERVLGFLFPDDVAFSKESGLAYRKGIAIPFIPP